MDKGQRLSAALRLAVNDARPEAAIVYVERLTAAELDALTCRLLEDRTLEESADLTGVERTRIRTLEGKYLRKVGG